MWALFGSVSGTRNHKQSVVDRLPLQKYIDELNSRELLGVEGQPHGIDSSTQSFMAVPLNAIHHRIYYNARLADTMVNFSEERTRQLQRMLRDQRKKLPAVPVDMFQYTTSSLERALSDLNRVLENEILQTHERASAIEIRVRQKLTHARDTAVCCTLEYESALHDCEQNTQRAREKLHRSKLAHARAIERLSAIRTHSDTSLLSSSLLGFGREREVVRNTVNVEHEIFEAEETIENAGQQIEEDSKKLLRCLYHQDRISAAVALAFEACDRRLRDALAEVRCGYERFGEIQSQRLSELYHSTYFLQNLFDAERKHLPFNKRTNITRLCALLLRLSPMQHTRKAKT